MLTVLFSFLKDTLLFLLLEGSYILVIAQATHKLFVWGTYA